MQTDMRFSSCPATFSQSGRTQARVRFAASLRLAALCAAATGCAATCVERGAEFYGERRYIDAAQVFEHNERQLAAYEAKERAEYAVYRGATFLALGDRKGARQWLDYGARIGDGLLSPEARTLLVQSMRAVETMPTGGGVGLQAAHGLPATPALLRR